MIVTVANHKGGVGKTSLAAHLVFRAAERCRVLAVDLDAQANLTQTLVARADAIGQPSSDALFTDEQPPRPMATADRNIDLLPASARLTGSDRLNLSAAFQARNHLRQLAQGYGLVVLDSAPALGLRLTMALASSRRVLVPLIPEAYAVDGVASLLSEAAAIQEHLNTELAPADFVLNLVNRQASQHARIAHRLDSSFRVLKPYLHRHIAVAEALANGQPVWRRRRHIGAAREWTELCDLLLSEYGLPAATAHPSRQPTAVPSQVTP
jgi:chromosome partitioning protein